MESDSASAFPMAQPSFPSRHYGCPSSYPTCWYSSQPSFPPMTGLDSLITPALCSVLRWLCCIRELRSWSLGNHMQLQSQGDPMLVDGKRHNGCTGRRPVCISELSSGFWPWTLASDGSRAFLSSSLWAELDECRVLIGSGGGIPGSRGYSFATTTSKLLPTMIHRNLGFPDTK